MCIQSYMPIELDRLASFDVVDFSKRIHIFFSLIKCLSMNGLLSCWHGYF